MRMNQVHVDDPLVARARAGSRRAFARLWRDHEGQVRGIAASIAAAAADDIVQDVAAAALAGLSRLRGTDGDAFAAWLTTIARNRARTTLATRRRLWAIELGDASVETTPNDLSAAFGNELRDAVRAAVRALPRRLRVPLRLRYWRGCSAPQIAARLHTTSGSVRVSLCIGLRRLREGMARCG